jgi:hypothetical protein
MGIAALGWLEWRDSNPQPPVLETCRERFRIISGLCIWLNYYLFSGALLVQIVSWGFR